MTLHGNHHRDLEALIEQAVAKARALAGPEVEIEDLEQAARLAILEVESTMPRLDPDHDLRFLRRRVARALKAEIRPFIKRRAGAVDLDQLIEERADGDAAESSQIAAPPISLIWDGESIDEVVTKSELADHVREVMAGMAPETVQVVRLCFGLDGGDAVAPIDVADILDESPEVVLSHLWAAEKLFRHFSTEGRHRRLTRMTDYEFRAFFDLGDLAWYDLRDLNLNNTDLGSCDLSNAVLSGMNLWGLKLVGGRAVGINLWGAQLEGADLGGADLSEANLERTGLRAANLANAVVRNANLWGADLSNVQADHADLSGCDLRSAELAGADLTRTNLSGADLRGAKLMHTKLVGAELVGANLQGVDLGGCDLRWANLRNSDLCWASLSAADTRGASFEGAVRSPKLTGIFAARAPRPQRLRPTADSA